MCLGVGVRVCVVGGVECVWDAGVRAVVMGGIGVDSVFVGVGVGGEWMKSVWLGHWGGVWVGGWMGEGVSGGVTGCVVEWVG